jgi:hypothetical protein
LTPLFLYPPYRQWAFLALDVKDAAICIGEWGGWAGAGKGGVRDQTWQNAFAEYLATNDIKTNFYWAVNNNSVDTGGLLEKDWKTPVAAKLEIVRKACPAPTAFPKAEPPIPPVTNVRVTTAASRTNSWTEAGVQHQQYDVVVKNDATSTSAAGASLRLKVVDAKVVNIWNVTGAVGGGAYKLPGWLLDNGGLKPGASFTFGCITSGKTPKFEVST